MGADRVPTDNSPKSFAALGILDLLQADARPTFAISTLGSEWQSAKRLQPVFSNKALNDCVDLKNGLFGDVAKSPTLNAFIVWLCDTTRLPGSTYNYDGREWCCTSIDTWLVVGTTRVRFQSQTDDSARLSTHSTKWPRTSRLDWTQISEPIRCPEYVEYLRSRDWRSTSVGCMSTWSSELRTFFNLIMRTEVAQALYWGDDLTAIYNSGFIPITGGKHPQLLGQPCSVGWSEDWAYFEGIFEEGRRTGRAREIEQCMMIQRSGFIEEVYFDYTNMPVIGATGTILGFLVTVRETTKTVLAKRRLATTTNIVQQISAVIEVDDLCRRFLDGLETNKQDIAFAAIYVQDMDGCVAASKTKPNQEMQKVFLKGFLGLLEGALPAVIDYQPLSSNFSALLQAAQGAQSYIVLQKEDSKLASLTNEVIAPEYGHGAGFEQAILYPLRIARRNQCFGFLLMGLNTRCRFNEVYEQFITSIGGQLNDALTTTIVRQLELREQQEQAELKQIALEARLEHKTRQARNMEQRFTKLTAASPAAVCIAKPDGTIKYANDMFRTYFGAEANWYNEPAWMKNIYEEDLAETARVWHNVTALGTIANYEYRITKPWTHPISKDICLPYTWLVANAYPAISEDGDLEYVSTGIDISLQKWTQHESQIRTEEVLEAKRQQDAFTDMVAHEIRNPLNAILQSADMIQISMENLRDQNIPSALAGEVLENAQTITHCTLHQKKIIDDLLVLSKLDSDLLSFVPVVSQPTVILAQIVKMFRVDADANDIKLTSELDSSLIENHITWAMLDPQRVSQVLINLVTNAIKFTKGCPVKSVTIRLEAATNPSLFKKDNDFKFFSTNRARPRLELAPEDIFLMFSVTDTGPGITPEAEAHLFRRFSQESLRTHIVYGGSGLGLWVSRELTEMQGGEIGFRTIPGVGTTFAFYVRTKLASLAPGDTMARGSTPTQSPNTVAASSTTPVQTTTQASGGQDQLYRHLKSLTILLTEDNLVNQRVMKKQLSRIFGQVLVANHGGEAIETIKRSRLWSTTHTIPTAPASPLKPIHPSTEEASHSETTEEKNTPDVILMDVEMPTMNGVDCTRQIRLFESQGLITTHIPIVAVSANARFEQVSEYRAAGMDDVLSKPFVIRDLAALIERLVVKVPRP